jgi:NTP pyrophosphatase (non-canonical NTP hydrolase)
MTEPAAPDTPPAASAAAPTAQSPLDIAALQATLRRFAAERDWPRFHTPKNLAMALVVEAAEVVELFQWQTPDQSQGARSDAAHQARIGEEVADVLLYLVQLADQCGVDIGAAVQRKLALNAAKHPVGRPPLA